MTFPVFVLAAAAVCPPVEPVANAPGITAVGSVPAATAMQLNAEGKQLYRKERWDEARQKYRAALAADPELLGARLNIACSFSRQQHYAQAAEEAASLIRTAFVPWEREVREAADLGILQDHPAAYAIVKSASSEAATAWGAEALRGIPLVARTKPPLKLVGEGVLVLGLGQEAFAWVPETNRFLQLTAEDGRVLAIAVSQGGQRVAYLLGGKVVRSPGQPALLRGLSVRVLTLPTMMLSKAVQLPGDLRKVQLAFAAHPTVRLVGQSSQATFDLDDEGLHETTAPMSSHVVELTALGVRPGHERVRNPCPLRLSSDVDEHGRWRIRIGKERHLDTPYGAGLGGLPFPDIAYAPASVGRK